MEEKLILLAGKSKTARWDYREPKHPDFDTGFKFYHQKNFHYPDVPMFKDTHTCTYIDICVHTHV